MTLVGTVLMAITLIVFAGYGLAANAVRHHVRVSRRLTRRIQRTFAAAFALAAARLAMDGT